uniref:Uncharacterized protein n=1 Tax=Triticum urartu TaxID=4572 RepID=A0A8R7PF51_TRIUA
MQATLSSENTDTTHGSNIEKSPQGKLGLGIKPCRARACTINKEACFLQESVFSFTILLMNFGIFTSNPKSERFCGIFGRDAEGIGGNERFVSPDKSGILGICGKPAAALPWDAPAAGCPGCCCSCCFIAARVTNISGVTFGGSLSGGMLASASGGILDSIAGVMVVERLASISGGTLASIPGGTLASTPGGTLAGRFTGMFSGRLAGRFPGMLSDMLAGTLAGMFPGRSPGGSGAGAPGWPCGLSAKRRTDVESCTLLMDKISRKVT